MTEQLGVVNWNGIEPFRVWGLEELDDDDFRPTWLHKGWRSHPSHGIQAGMEKTLKSWIAATEAVAVASGLPLFGELESVTSGPVVIFTSESGRHLYHRRLRHVARAFGLEDDAFTGLPIHVIDERATTRSARFRATLESTLNGTEQVLTIVDPLYAYHGSDVEAGNVYAASEVLNAMSEITDGHGSSLNVVTHFRKSAEGRLSLTDITQAGPREWSESWVLVGHQEPPTGERIAEGRFSLNLSVGGRQWDGDQWSLDLTLGALDRDVFDYSGAVSYDLSRGYRGKTSVRRQIEDWFLDQAEPGAPRSKNKIYEGVGGHRTNVLEEIDRMADDEGCALRRQPTDPPKFFWDLEWQEVLSTLGGRG